MADGAIRLGDFIAAVKQTRDVYAAAATFGVRAAVEGMKADFRAAIIAAGLGPKVANAVGSKMYPERGTSIGAAGRVYARGAAGRQVGNKILDAFSRGVTIRAKGRRYLAIPAENVPRSGGRGNARIGPKEVERRFGRKLILIAHPGKAPVLALPNDARHAGKRGLRFASAKTGRGTRDAVIVMFVLVKSVRLGKRIDPEALNRKWQAAVPVLIQRALPQGA